MHAHDLQPLEPESTGRRTFLKWLTHGLGAAFAVTLGAPAVLYFLDPRHRPARSGAFKTVAKLSDLKPGVPQQATIREIRRDAWTLHPNDIVGRVWLVRRNDNQIDAFTVTCPHLGCSVNYEGDQFVCPCHNGTFTVDGKRADPGAGRTNPAPRDMDALEVQLIADPENPADKLVQVKFQSFVQGAMDKILRS